MGFEPMRENTPELESGSLDLSDTNASCYTCDAGGIS